MMAVSGMTFQVSPAWICVTLMTAELMGSILHIATHNTLEVLHHGAGGQYGIFSLVRLSGVPAGSGDGDFKK